MFKFFDYVAGSDTFSFNKPDPRHLTDVVEIIQGDIKINDLIVSRDVASLANGQKVKIKMSND